MKHALKELSERQSNRVYSSNNNQHGFTEKRSKHANSATETSSMINGQRTVSNKKYQEFLNDNRKNFELDRSDYDIYGPDERILEQSTHQRFAQIDDGSESCTSGQQSSDASERPPLYNQPRPPKGKKPEIKKKLNSQRISRLGYVCTT